jgi:hypothetical protein
MTPAGERAQLDLGRELLLTRDGGLQQVKIRWGHFGLPVPTAFGPPVRRSAGDRDILTLSADEALVVACAAGATRMWERLVWLHEFAQMVAAHPDVLGAELRERVRRHGAERRWFLGLVLAHDLLDAGPGPEVLEPMRRAPGVSALSAQVQAQMFQEPPGWRRPSSRQRALFHLRARERSRDKVGYALARLMRPSAADAALLPLPRVGGIVRPLRLLGNVGGALAARFFPPAIADLSIFRPTPSDYVNRLLALARVSPDDTVFDLGSGDGRIIILAAQRYGARGVGVEIDPKLVAAARRRARAAGVERRVTFLEGDAKAVNLSPASVVTLYLRMSLKLQPTLKAQLRRGCRIVSLNFDMGDWLPDEVQLVEEPIGESNIFYLWRIGDGRDATSPWGTGAGRAPNAAQDTAARNG